MDNTLSLLEKRMIQSMLTRFSDQDIAVLINKPVELISEEINIATGGGVLKKSYSQKKNDKLLPPTKKVIPKVKLRKSAAVIIKREPKVTRDQIRIERKRNEERAFKTRQQDFSSMILVRIDHKTQVYVKQGTDIDAFREKYITDLANARNCAGLHGSRI
jgi:hypothetical protein